MNRAVSVIIPTYNYGHFIGEAIESALAQTFPVSEIIVVDNDSTDDTESVVRGFGERVTYIREPNLGVSAARNKGIESSKGDFIAFLDADDTWLPQKIEKQIAKMLDDPEIGVVHCGLREFDNASGETLALHLDGSEGWVADEMLLFSTPTIIGPGGTILVRREVFENVGGFDTRLTNGEDWEFCLRVARKYKIGFIAEPLVNYRNHGENAHLDVCRMERSTLIAWAKAFDTTDENVRRIRRRSYGNLHKVLAGSFLQSGQYGGFVRNLIKSLWFRPSFIGYYLTVPFRRNRKSP